jgi:hypothetical protein
MFASLMMDENGGGCRATCHDAIPNVRFASKRKLSATAAGRICLEAAAHLHPFQIPFPSDWHISTPYALSYLPSTSSHLPHRHKHNERLPQSKSCIGSRTHHLQHTSTRHHLPIYAQHPLLGCAFRIIKQHGGQHKLPGAEDGWRVASTAVTRYVDVITLFPVACLLTPSQSNSAFSVRRVQKCPALAHTTSTTPMPACTRAPAATHLSTRPTISSIRAVDGLPFGMQYRVLLASDQTLVWA